jgi:hypothetical protein
MKSSIPWHQYAALSYVAKKAPRVPALGKIALQKLIYLMQELSGVPVGYRFGIFHYGPSSSDLAEDLTYVSKNNSDSLDRIVNQVIEIKPKLRVEKVLQFSLRFRVGNILSDGASRRAFRSGSS